MRLNLFWRGRDVLDMEVHLWRRRDEPDEGPPLQAAAHPVDISRSEPMDPHTMTFGFGPTES